MESRQLYIFYYKTKDGREYLFKTQFCKRPTATKAYKKIMQMLNEYNDIHCVGYKIQGL
jgi:hypothetical protein